jgi:predicted peptidase
MTGRFIRSVLRRTDWVRSAMSMRIAFHEHTLVRRPTADASLSYLLHLPDDYGVDTERRWPLLLFLHGADERGGDLRRVTMHGPPKLIEAGQRFPFVVAAPQCPAYSSWPCELTTMSALLDEIASNHRIDPDRVYLTGLSMGGTGTWAMATRYPDRFAAIVPVCGGWLPEAAERIADVPVWTFHGDDDTDVPIVHTENMVEAVRGFGGDVRFTRYPGVGHDSWSPTYDNPDVYDWLLSHSRATRRVATAS